MKLVTVGGSSLMLLGLIERPTRDLDVVAFIEDGRYVKAKSLPASASSHSQPPRG